MNNRIVPAAALLLGVVLLLSISVSGPCRRASPGPDGSLDPSDMDTSVTACQNFFQYVNGGWLKKNPIPGDYARWGVWNAIEKRNFETIRKIMESAAAKTDGRGAIEQKVGDFWFDGMDTKTMEEQDIKPLAGELGQDRRADGCERAPSTRSPPSIEMARLRRCSASAPARITRTRARSSEMQIRAGWGCRTGITTIMERREVRQTPAVNIWRISSRY